MPAFFVSDSRPLPMHDPPPDSARPGASAAPAASRSPKPAWPLFVAAGLAFVPILGILFGAIGLTWGLLSSRPRAIRAALIAGAGAALNLAVVLGAGAYFASRNTDAFDAVTTARTQQDLVTLIEAIERYHDENDAYPPSLSALQRRPAALRTINIFDPMAGILSPKIYPYTLSRDGRHYDVFSRGADGEAGTPDDVRPVLPDSLAARAGYRPAASPES